MQVSDWRGEFLTEIGDHHGDEVAVAATEALEGLEGLGLRLRRQAPVPSKGLAIGVMEPSISTWNSTLLVGHGRLGTVGWELLRLRKHNPFRIQAKEDELRLKLAVIPGFVDRPDYPTVTWVGLADGGLQPFLEAASWTAERVRKSNPAG